MNTLEVFLSFLSFIAGILLGKIFLKYNLVKPVLKSIEQDITLVMKHYLMNSESVHYFDRSVHKSQYYKRLEDLLHYFDINIGWWYLYKILNNNYFKK